MIILSKLILMDALPIIILFVSVMILSVVIIILLFKQPGDKGNIGPKGIKGGKGEIGIRGKRGKLGKQGNKGPTGIKGLQGKVGNDSVIKHSVGKLNCLTNLNSIGGIICDKNTNKCKCKSGKYLQIVGDEEINLGNSNIRIEGNKIPLKSWDKWTLSFWIKVNTPSQEKIRNVLLWGDNHVRFPSIMVGPNSSNIWKYPMDSLILQWNNSYLNSKKHTNIVIPKPTKHNRCSLHDDLTGCMEGILPIGKWVHFAIVSHGKTSPSYLNDKNIESTQNKTIKTKIKIYINSALYQEELIEDEKQYKDFLNVHSQKIPMEKIMKSKKFNVPYKKGVIDDMSKGSKSINIPLQDRINDEKILNTSYVDDSNGIFIRRMIWCDSPLNEYAIWDKMMNRFNY